MKTSLKNSRGSALLNVLIVGAIVAGISAVIMTQTGVTDKSSRGPRIKSAMTVLETQMLSLAMQPGIYQGCSDHAQNCQLSSSAAAAFQNLNRTVVGAACPGSSPGSSPGASKGSTPVSCGVKVQAPSALACLNSMNPNYNSACAAGQFYNAITQTFCAEIVYQGTEVPMQPVCASTTVPQSVLQGTATACNAPANLTGPYPKVIFRGYDAAGNAVCSNIPACSGGNITAAGTYITSIDKLTVQTQCRALGSGAPLTCPAGTIISSLRWGNVSSAFGSLTPVANCQLRRDPADTHIVSAATPITVPPSSYTPVPPASPPPTSPPTTMPAACASPSNPFTTVDYKACSASPPPGNPACVSGPGFTPHGTNYGNSNVSLTIHIQWNGIDSYCNYSGYLTAGGSTGSATGSCSPVIPGVAAGYVDFFNTSPGAGSGLNITGMVPIYTGTCP